MATITVSLGEGTSHDTAVDITAVTGTGPWTVTLGSGEGANADVGDALWDEAATPNKYLITGISGDDLTVEDKNGNGTGPDSSGTSQAYVKRYYNGAVPITDWEADLDDTNLYAAGDDALGECYHDAAFDEAPTINGGSTLGLNSAELTVAAGEMHDGTAGTGARVVRTGASCLTLAVPSGYDNKYTVSGLEIDMNGNAGPAITTSGAVYGNVPIVRRMIAHDQSGGNSFLGFVDAQVRDCQIQNAIFYDNSRSTTLDAYGLNVDGDQTSGGVFNVTVYKVANTGTGGSQGIHVQTDSASGAVKNAIAMGTTAGGTDSDFWFAGTSTDSLNNMSEDLTADDAGGTGHLLSKAVGDQFVSTVNGSEDLHLKSGADAIDAGIDLGTTPTGVNIDIDGRDRDAQGDTWDMGADEYVAAVTTRQDLTLLGVGA